ncbi:hypothetical protein OAN38_01150 [Candidatus Marinimicrobia bacterium]|nr:hypothetical protein [Candidatus Neomarinimicrobiota bacterium]MDC0383428.1 hypothetical protein [Candidatus Neomarinimicrobiota bacterium]
MSKNILKRSLLVASLLISSIAAQDKVDAIEAARQAKAAAEKAAADAEAATDAAIEQAAKNAAKDAREKIKQDRLDEEARKIAEAKAAEEAELDAAANAAAEEAKKKMAEELGLEYESPVTETAGESPATEEVSVEEEEAEEVVAKEDLGWSVGAALSAGLIKGATFTGVPTGGTVVITTPFSFKVGPLDYTVSLGAGGYSGEHNETSFNPSFAGLGGNLTLADLVFAEGHVGLVGEGTGFRGFAGVSLERLIKKGLDLPFNVLVGSESFYSTDMAGAGNASYWAALGVRLDYSF